MINRSAFFKAVHAVARKLEGDYQARLKLAYHLVSSGKLVEVRELFTREEMSDLVSLSLEAGISAEVIASACEAAETPKAETPQKPKKVRKTRARKEAPEVDFADTIKKRQIPQNIERLFGSRVAGTIQHLTDQFAYYASTSAGLDGQRYPRPVKLEDVNAYNDGMDALANVSDFQELQGIMTAYFLRPLVSYYGFKFLTLGIGYKRLNRAAETAEMVVVNTNEGQKEVNAWEQAMSYQNAPSSTDAIGSYELEEVVNEVVADAFSKVFDENMFNSPQNAVWSIWCRTSNAVQRMKNALRKQTKVYTASAQYVQGNLNVHLESYADLLTIADAERLLTDAELEVLRLSLAGFRKVEIQQIIGKRPDRTFDSLRRKLAAVM